MNETNGVDTTDTFVNRAIPLLKEYFAKILDIREQLLKIREQYESDKTKYGPDTVKILQLEADTISQHYQRLLPAVRQFTQQVSGMVDQGKISPLIKAELQLRLAELESVMIHTPALLNAYRPR